MLSEWAAAEESVGEILLRHKSFAQIGAKRPYLLAHVWFALFLRTDAAVMENIRTSSSSSPGDDFISLTFFLEKNICKKATHVVCTQQSKAQTHSPIHFDWYCTHTTWQGCIQKCLSTTCSVRVLQPLRRGGVHCPLHTWPAVGPLKPVCMYLNTVFNCNICSWVSL